MFLWCEHATRRWKFCFPLNNTNNLKFWESTGEEKHFKTLHDLLLYLRTPMYNHYVRTVSNWKKRKLMPKYRNIDGPGGIWRFSGDIDVWFEQDGQVIGEKEKENFYYAGLSFFKQKIAKFNDI